MPEVAFRQLTLDIALPHEASLDDLVVGENEEVLAQLYALIHEGLPVMTLYLWGGLGVGKTHIIRSLAVAQHALCLSEADLIEPMSLREGIRWYLLDDVAELSARAQVGLYDVFNQIRHANTRIEDAAERLHLIVTAEVPPRALPANFLPDLKTRLAWDWVYPMHGLNDEDKVFALMHLAEIRGMAVAPAVYPYLLTHCGRDFNTLRRMLAQLDELSLERQQAVTLPLVKSWLAAQPPHAPTVV